MRVHHALLVGSLLVACAQVGDITGGDKDGTPPRLVGADPPHLSTSFRSSRIVLRFDERIRLDRVRDRMLVSPPLDKPPTVRVTGAKNVTIDLNGPLKDGTTYTFGIGEAVKDLTEGNAAAGLSYVISTGPVLDSMHVGGSVSNAFSGAPEKEVLVVLYSVDDTVGIRTGRPAYATRSDAQGRFTFEHLRTGRYRLYALRDQNANYRYDLPNEEVAFLDDAVVLDPGDTTTRSYALRLFREIGRVLSVREARVTADGALLVVLTKPGTDIGVRDVVRTGGVLHWTPQWSIERDTVRLWPSDTVALAEGRYELSVNGEVLDTLRYRRSGHMAYHLGVRAVLRETEEAAIVDLRTTRPIAKVDGTRIRLEQDSMLVPFRVEHDGQDVRSVRLYPELPPGGAAELVLLPKALQDIYGGYNDSLVTGLGRAAEKSTGTMRVRLDERVPRNAPAIIQLLDMQGNTVRESVLPLGERDVSWERLTPGNHTMRLILDVNGNGRWDTGDLDLGRQPEPVIPYPGTINIRAAWDLGLDLRIE